MRIKERLRSLIHILSVHDSLVSSVAFYVFAQVADHISSLLTNKIPGVHEGNIFAHTINGEYDPLHGFLVKLLATFGITIFASTLYRVVKPFNTSKERYADLTAALPFIYYGWAVLSTALDNTFFALRFHIPRY